MGTQDTTIVNEPGEAWSGLEGEAVPTDEGALPRGSKVGRYLVLGELGRGGMGVVYRAYDPELDRPLALKRLRRLAAPDSPARARLRREAQTLARASDPHVVTIYDVDVDEGGQTIAMELIEGEDLASWLARGPHPWPEVVERFVAAGRGLAAAHRVGVTHRDFKPANVLLGRDGRVVVTDFGLARAESGPVETPSGEEETGAGDESLTRVGVRVGTPAYMAPEQHQGNTADARSDQYAFCVALFEGLFGQRPFRAHGTAELASLKRAGRIEWPSTDGLPRAIPRSLRRLLGRGLDPRPERRFETMEALLARLDPGPRRRGLATAVVTGLAVVAVVGVMRSSAADDPCAASDRALESSWSPGTRESMRTGLAAVDLPYAERAAETAVEALDDWAARYAQAHRSVCEATWLRAEQSPRALDLRMGCLDDQRLAFEATVSALAEAGPTIVENTTTVLAGLPTPARCTLLEPGPEGAASTRSGASIQARSRVAELDAMRRAGRGAEALSAAETLAREVMAGLDPETAAALQLLLGILRDDAGDFGGARMALEEAARLARERGDARTEAEAWTELTRVIGTHQHDADQGRFFGDLALAATAAAGGDADLRARARLELGEVAFRSGDLDAAREHWAEAVVLWSERDGPQALSVARVQARLAGVDFEQGDLEAARDSLERVVTRYRETLGPGHPRVAAPLGNLGLVRSALGEHEAAAEHMRQAIGIAERSRGPHHPQVAGGHDALGQALAAAGRWQEASTEFEAAIDGFERSLGPEHPALVTALTGLGQARLELGRVDEAVAPLERSLTLATSADLPPVQIADARFALARAMSERDLEGARRLASEASEVYEQHLPPDDSRRAKLEAWSETIAAPVDDAPAP